MEEDRLEIANLFHYYVSIILEEYKEFIPLWIKNRFFNITNFLDFIKIENSNTISLFVTKEDGIIHLPIDAYQVINSFKNLVEYGSNRDHKAHDNTNMVLNENTFLDFVNHIIIKGASTLDYFKEILLHETLHACGSDGGSALAEGFNELKTRELAVKYNLYTSCCGYPKETRIAYELEKLFGKKISDNLCFLSFSDRLDLLEKELGVGAKELYLNIYLEMEKEFKPYIEKKYPGLNGIKEKCEVYEKINYSKVYEFLEEYKNKKIV